LSSDVRNAFHEVGSKPIWPSYIHGILTRAFPAAVTPSDTSSKPLDEFESERLGHLKVLVAEDNSTNQKVIRLLLRRLGIEADLVANGLEAVNASSAQAYDIILLDIQMPVMDGLEAARQIRKQALSSRPFIIALTANVFREDRDATVAAGMDGYLSKPVSLSRLRETFSSIALPRRSPPPPNHETNTTRYQSIRNIC
jgi:CheY-like chemotaxis protein